MTLASFVLVTLSRWFLNGRSFKVPRLADVDLKSGAFTANDAYNFNFLNGSPVNSELVPFLARPSATSNPPLEPARLTADRRYSI
jgi:hypothetical protein